MVAVMKPACRAKPGYGHVHAVPAGDERRDRDDRRPARHLLHDLVRAEVAQAEVGLDDRAHEVAERVGRLGDPQDVVVDVLVVRVERLVDEPVVSPHQTRSPPHASERRVGGTGSATWRISNQFAVGADRRVLREDAFAHVVVELVELVEGGEVPVDDDVEQAVHAETRRRAWRGPSIGPSVRAPVRAAKPSSLRTVTSQRGWMNASTSTASIRPDSIDIAWHTRNSWFG